MSLIFHPCLFSAGTCGLGVSRVTLSRLGYLRQLKRAYAARHEVGDGGQIGNNGQIGDAGPLCSRHNLRSHNRRCGQPWIHDPICHCYRPSGLIYHHQPIITNLAIIHSWASLPRQTAYTTQVLFPVWAGLLPPITPHTKTPLACANRICVNGRHIRSLILVI